jgi:hypothetical protein
MFSLLLDSESCLGASKDKAASRKKNRVSNLPDITTTESGRFNVQEEINLFAEAGYLNTTVDYGLRNQWNIGISALNVQFYGAFPQAFDPELLFNLEKTFTLAANWRIAAGVQTGASPFHHGLRQWQNYVYLDNQLDWPDLNSSIHCGGYFANAAFSGRGDTVGFLMGVDVPLPAVPLRLTADYISGDNAVGMGSVLLQYQAAPAWQLLFGVQTPTIGSRNDFSGLFEINWN